MAQLRDAHARLPRRSMVGRTAPRPRFAKVAGYLRTAIAAVPGDSSFQELLVQLLAQPGRALSAERPSHWPVFVFDVCRALGGDLNGAIPAGAAVELAVAAIDVADDLMDDEWDLALGSAAQGMNAAVALSWLAQRCARDLVGLVGDERAGRVADLLTRGSLASCSGQDLDTRLEAMPYVTEDLALQMTRSKSGALIGMACLVGAVLATDDETALTQVGEFGTSIGVIAQLLNDLGGVDPDEPARGSDLVRRKKTLPVAYALRCAQEEGLTDVLDWYDRSDDLGAEAEQLFAERLRDLGATHYTWVVADVYRREALRVLRALAQQTGRGEVRLLRGLIPSLRPKSQS